MGDKPDLSEIASFDKTKLKEQQVEEKSQLPTSEGYIFICLYNFIFTTSFYENNIME